MCISHNLDELQSETLINRFECKWSKHKSKGSNFHFTSWSNRSKLKSFPNSFQRQLIMGLLAVVRPVMEIKF